MARTPKSLKRLSAKQPHPWRICQLGSHFVKEHHRRTKKGIVVVKGHCRKSPIHREILSIDEILEMFKRNRDQIDSQPNESNLGYKNENKYNALIGLWTQFWNEVYPTTPPLDPNWVKALMATESGFDPKSINKSLKPNIARGLLQINKQTYKILTDSKGELKDVLFRMDQKDLFVPDINIASGVRWLFHKKRLLKAKIGRDPSWEESIWEYKGIYEKSDESAQEIKNSLREKYEKIRDHN